MVAEDVHKRRAENLIGGQMSDAELLALNSALSNILGRVVMRRPDIIIAVKPDQHYLAKVITDTAKVVEQKMEDGGWFKKKWPPLFNKDIEAITLNELKKKLLEDSWGWERLKGKSIMLIDGQPFVGSRAKRPEAGQKPESIAERYKRGLADLLSAEKDLLSYGIPREHIAKGTFFMPGWAVDERNRIIEAAARNPKKEEEARKFGVFEGMHYDTEHPIIPFLKNLGWHKKNLTDSAVFRKGHFDKHENIAGTDTQAEARNTLTDQLMKIQGSAANNLLTFDIDKLKQWAVQGINRKTRIIKTGRAMAEKAAKEAHAAENRHAAGKQVEIGEHHLNELAAHQNHIKHRGPR